MAWSLAVFAAAPEARANQAMTLTTGRAVTLSVAAEGTQPFTYQWRKDGVNVPGATAASYQISSFGSGHTGVYTVTVANSAGSTVSDAATLALEAAVAPVITAQPLSQTALSGSSVSFTAGASGTNPLSYRWRRNGVDLHDGGNVSGAATSTLSLAGLSVSDSGTYTLVVSNAAGSATTGGATLTVTSPVQNPPPSAEPATVSPSFATQPISQSVNEGAIVLLSGQANGTPAPGYQWRRNGVNLVDGGKVSGATTGLLTLSNVTTGDAGTYTLVATNSAGTANSSGAVLTVSPATTSPVFATQPATTSVQTGASVSFSANASGSPAPTYQWRRNGVNLANGGNVSGANSNTLTLTGVSSSDAATYTVVASNSAGSAVSQGAVLTVAAASNPPPTNPTTPTSPTTPSTPQQPEEPTTPSTPARSALPFPVAVAVASSGEIYVADAGLDQLFRIATNGTLHVLAGAEGQVGAEDGTGTGARFNDPSGLALSGDGQLIVADRANALVRLVDSAGRVTRLAGSSQFRGAADGPVASATFSSPVGVARSSSGVIYVADAMMHTIRRISPSGEVSTLAGAAGSPGDADGRGGEARFNQPTGLAVDSSGALYVADTGNNLIRRVAEDGTVSTVAGIFGVSGSRDGLGGEALFNQPHGLAVDRDGNLYVADTGNSTVRKISPQGVVSTLAGLPGVSGLRDGQGSDAWLSQPRALAINASGLLYVADTGNASIRRISSSGSVTTLSLGDAVAPPSGDTPPANPAPNPTPSTPAPSPAPSSGGSGGGGGGGSTGGLCVLALAALFAARRVLRARGDDRE